MHKIATFAGVLALLFLAGVAGPTAAHADPACVEAGISGSITGSHRVEECVPTSRQVLCVWRWAEFGTYIRAEARVCVPIPGQLPVGSSTE